MVKVYVADGPDFGPVVTEVKGVRGGREWVANEIQDALAYNLDGSVRVRWEEHYARHQIPLGQIVATPGALEALREAGDEPMMYLIRHQTRDWGEVPEEDAKENELSVRERFRILSAYTLKTGVKIWIITESDRSATTSLFAKRN
jgi:hypothetical protein